MFTMPTSASRAFERRIGTARPCESSRWCAAASASLLHLCPGAWTPMPYPRKAAHHGSLCVVQCFTRSPSALLTTSAYSANA